MWQWLLISLLVVTTHSFAGVPPSSRGPTSDEEAALLWKDGQKAYDLSNYSEAIQNLQRLVDRYPGKPGYLQAHYLLGHSLVKSGDTKHAIEPLRYFIAASSPADESWSARLLLAQAYLDTGKFQEAKLTALEIQNRINQKNLPAISPDFVIEAVLVRSAALFGLKHFAEAAQLSQSAEGLLTPQSSAALTGKTLLHGLKMKTFQCSQLGSKGPLSEAQLRNQFDRRGSCLLEALLIFQRIAKAEDTLSLDTAEKELGLAFQTYRHACLSPPQASGVVRTPKQALQFRAELGNSLFQDFKKVANRSQELLTSWKSSSSPIVQGSIQRLSMNLEHWTERGKE